MEYTTTDGVIINSRIEKGLTKLFGLGEFEKAEIHAKKNHSYVYNVMLRERKKNPVLCGYGVPK